MAPIVIVLIVHNKEWTNIQRRMNMNDLCDRDMHRDASCNGEYGTEYSDDAAGDAFGGEVGT